MEIINDLWRIFLPHTSEKYKNAYVLKNNHKSIAINLPKDIDIAICFSMEKNPAQHLQYTIVKKIYLDSFSTYNSLNISMAIVNLSIMHQDNIYYIRKFHNALEIYIKDYNIDIDNDLQYVVLRSFFNKLCWKLFCCIGGQKLAELFCTIELNLKGLSFSNSNDGWIFVNLKTIMTMFEFALTYEDEWDNNIPISELYEFN